MTTGIEVQSENPPAARAPWSPTGIAVVSLLLSPIPGAILHALNYARLGHPERKRLALFSNLIAGMVVFVFLRSLATSLFIAAYFYKSQEQLFDEYCSQGKPRASLLKPVGILVAVILILSFVLYALNS